MFAIRDETALDVGAREDLLDRCFGPDRVAKTSERLREGRLPADGLALVVEGDGRLAATVRLWNVSAGPGRPALLLGPIAVEPRLQGAGIGGKLLRAALATAGQNGHGAVILVGDEPYYRRFGFTRDLVSGLWMPGPCDRDRFLGLELRRGALAGARGLVSPTGRDAPRPGWAELMRSVANDDGRLVRAG